MQPFTALTAKAAPLDIANLDTDQIIPKQFLKTVEREGLAAGLFYDLRFDGEGRERADFVLNRPEYKGCGVLVTGDNFGCGSSREHAAWALLDFGIRCVIAPSFADIFFNNCLLNGLLPAVLSEQEVDRLFHATGAFPGFRLTIDLEAQMVSTLDGAQVFRFAIEPFRKHCLLNGLDEIALTLAHADEIRAFEAKHLAEKPWLA